MKTRALFLLIAAMFMLPAESNGQIGVLRRAINRQIDQKIDSAIDKSVQDSRDKKLKEDSEKNQSDTTADKKNSGRKGVSIGIFGGTTDIKHNDEYSFTGKIYTQMESYENKDVVKSDFYTYFNSNTLNAGIEVRPVNPKKGEASSPTIFIFDNDNRCLMMLIEDGNSKTGIISTIPDDSTLAVQEKPRKGTIVDKTTVTKTGNSRTIAGYRCDEYKVVENGEEGYSNVWMTKDLKIKADKRNWEKAGIPVFYSDPEFEGSIILASESYDKNDKLEIKMETIEINDNFKHSISTANYAFIKMNFNQTGKK
jgi:hypothetical protein